MDWALLIPVDGSELREAVLRHLAELDSIVAIKSKNFADHTKVWDSTEEGRQAQRLAAYAETIPRKGMCYISAELAHALKLFHPMNAREIATRTGRS